MKPIKWASLFAALLSVSFGPFVSSAHALRSCEDWVAKVVAVEGSVQGRRSGETTWLDAELNDTYCANDMLAVNSYSRAAILLRNEAVLRLDQNTAVAFKAPEKERVSWVDFLRGAIHFFSRIPRSLTVTTPFVNASVEGTEFFVRVDGDETFLSIFQGRVIASNDFGSLVLSSGQAGGARAREAPVLRAVARPRDAVQWALYYPPVLESPSLDWPGRGETSWQALAHESLHFLKANDPTRALASIQGAPKDVLDARFFTYRATLLLSVGRVDEANRDLATALTIAPYNSEALALQAVVAVVQNNKDRALELAKKAVELDSQSIPARIALSYAQQAGFDLQGAVKSLQEAVKVNPQSALAHARLAELWLSLGRLDRALSEAKRAVGNNPQLARTQTVLGFAYLTQIKTKDAKEAFNKAIELDQADPLPRLGLGLAKIREGDLQEGRQEIEISADLDPNNALIRSYMGKAYFEEKKAKLASDQFAIAKELDPLDPTPWFYDAIQKQTLNRPVDALHDLQKSIELNNNRAVYRSKLQLDQDLAARSANLASIYQDLGFEQLALVEGWKSLDTDPANYSAHRFLADSYSILPRHEIARVSELLQSQLLQPINITPIQPQLAVSNLFILEGAGPSRPSFNEFNPLFNRNRFAAQASQVFGSNDIFGDSLTVSGVWQQFSCSLGQFHYETDGFRPNNDLTEDIYNAFFQYSLAPATSVQMEFRKADIERGDLLLRFNPNNFDRQLRKEDESQSERFGFHHAFSPNSDIIASAIHQRAKFDTDIVPGVFLNRDEDGYLAEVQHLYRNELFHLITGVGYFTADKEAELSSLVSSTDSHHTNLYLYSLINWPMDITWTLGGSGDFFKGTLEREQFNPKLGMSWNILTDTRLRAAAFRVLKRSLIADQTIEPTQVAGFNQFFDDAEGTESWRYGVGLDQRFSDSLFGGLEFSMRDLDVPLVTTSNNIPETLTRDWKEQLARSYLFWTPHPWLALTAEYQFEHFERARRIFGEEDFLETKTHRLPFGISFFHPTGFTAQIKATYVDQEGTFGTLGGRFEPDSDQFWVVDASLCYRLPNRWGFIQLGAKNLLGEHFRFQDTDPKNPSIIPERLLFVKYTLAY